MAISVTTSKQQITASVAGDNVTASVSGGFGATGPSGVVAVSAPITNSGTSTAANVGLSVGTGLGVSLGSLTVTYGTSSTSACAGNDARLSDSREWSAITVTQAQAEAGASSDRVAFTPLRVFQAVAAWWEGSSAKTKLDGIASGATANATDAQLRDRATHTGTQTASTISDFAAAVAAAAPATTDASLLTSGTLAADRLPLASANTRGAVRIGSGVTIADGVISVSTNYAAASHAHAAADITFAATDRLLGRSSAGAGAGEEIVCTAAGRALLDDADTATQRTTLGLGTLATQSGTFSGTSSGTNTGDQTITLTGDVTGSGTGSFAATLANTTVTAASYGSSSQVATFTVDAKGRITAAGSTAIAIASSAVSGLGGAATLNVGTTSGTVAAGDHTHSQLHERSHAITSTSDHTATNWRLFHSNGSGQVVELAFGSSGQALLSNGASAAPSWGSVASSPTVASPSQITSNQNDYAGATADINRITSDAARDITGIAAGTDGQAILLLNVGSFAITLKHQSASSTAANRILVPWGGDCVIPADASAALVYDNTTARWRVI